jgi:hypothetical protein
MALMTHKTTELYYRVFEKINGECFRRFGRNPSPTDLVSEYILEILNALQRAYPTGVARGCLFHESDVSEMPTFFSLCFYV